jgi:hypothetical protein
MDGGGAVQEARFVVRLEAYSRCERRMFKSLVTLKMEAVCSPKRRFLLDPHGVISQKNIRQNLLWL